MTTSSKTITNQEINDELARKVDRSELAVVVSRAIKNAGPPGSGGSGEVTSSDIVDATTAGRALLTANGAAQQKAILAVTKADVGLPNADNTADVNKPVSSAQAAALAAKAPLTHQHSADDVNAGTLAAARYSASMSAALDAMLAAQSGDILYRGPNGWQRLPKGSVGQVLSFGADSPSWATVSGGVVTPTNVAPANSILPGISGVYQTGQTLTATTGTWTGTPTPTYAYQWYTAPPPAPSTVDPTQPTPPFDPSPLTAIAGATNATYLVQSGDLGKVIYVRVTASNAAGNTVAYSAATGKIVSPVSLIPVNTFLPQVTGVTQVGSTLTATPGSWTNSPTSYAYQWRRNGVPISGATSTTYLLASGDAGTAITVAVVATNASGSGAAAISNPTNSIAVVADATTAPILVSPPVITGSSVEAATLTSFQASWIESLTAPSNTALPTISGAAAQGQTLTAGAGSWDANPTPTYAYQWKAGGVNISGATASTFVLTSSEVGKLITVTVTATNSAGTAAATSLPTSTVTAPLAAPANTALPVISGTATEGQTLSVAGSGVSVIDPTNLAGTAVMTFEENWDVLSLWNGSSGRWATGYHWYPPQGGSLNDEQQWYITNTYAPTQSAVPWTVSNGVLSITANPTPSNLLSSVSNFPYTSGMLTTYRSFTQKYGYFVARLKLPKGQGFWPAFWMLPADGSWPPEIDIMENLGRDITHYYATTHWSSTNQQIGQYVSTPDLSLAFHDFGVRWDETNLTYYFDGVQVAQHANQSDMNQPFYMILNLALGGQWGGNVDGTTPFPASLQCDYVRAYTPAASTPGSWTNNPTSYAYQWKRAGSPISGATASSYTLTSADVGSAITVTVTASNAAGSAAATSAATASVAANTPTGGAGTIWNVADVTDVTAISNGGRTLGDGPYGGAAARSEKKITGKRYFEIKHDAGAGAMNIGFSNPSQIANVYDGPGRNGGTLGWQSWGAISVDWGDVNGGVSVSMPAVGEYARLCVDETARKLWVCVNTGSWNGNSSADPATGVGGITIPAGDLYVHFKWDSGNVDDAIILNTTSGQFAYSAPSGFSAIP